MISATSSNTNENSGMGRDLSGCTVQSVTAPLQMDSLAQVHFFLNKHTNKLIYASFKILSLQLHYNKRGLLSEAPQIK